MTALSWNVSSFNPYAPGYLAGLGIQLPLAAANNAARPIPVLLATAALNPKNVLTIRLRSAHFTNGERVNATDVVNSTLLMGLDNNTVFQQDLIGLSATNAETVVFRFAPSTLNIAIWQFVATIIPVPMSQYGRFVTPNLARNLWDYNRLLRSPATAASAPSSRLGEALDGQLVRLQRYNPRSLIGDGPFRLTAANEVNLKEVKSPTFYDAPRVHIPSITIWNTVDMLPAQFEALLFSHNIDWYDWFDGPPSFPEWYRWQHMSAAREANVDDDTTENLLFNDRAYPFDLLPVRQAVAQIIDPVRLLEAEDGGRLIGSRPDTLPDGLGGLLNNIWLSANQRSQLTSYAYNPTKAARLLESVGFTKAHDRWLQPDQRRFTVSIIAPEGPTTGMAITKPGLFARQAVFDLRRFGIAATSRAANGDQEEQGHFDLAWTTGVRGTLDPLCALATGGLGEPTNASDPATGRPGIGFGPDRVVPGLGEVPVASTIDTECQQVQAGPQLSALTWDWARLINRRLPFLTYGDEESTIFYLTRHYVDWPRVGSAMWKEAALVPSEALVLMMVGGYIRPAH